MLPGFTFEIFRNSSNDLLSGMFVSMPLMEVRASSSSLVIYRVLNFCSIIALIMSC
jgi:hypothetical protein